ncbi:outer membrane protein [Croceivirga thetidis]|uniref:Porin family protein n=1 Tax=Croceivirga thetidis TaxID=2721623 RepID=A0ABX1GN93_9FLAO|nr:OmpW family outer membrane protein [Croceivirga thetidis]NKI31109.1 porin family protein [Croceivirga thetidis]
MKLKLLVLLSIVLCSISFAQEKKWNVEANYTLVPGDGVFGEDNFIDVGAKFRFAKIGVFGLGFGINAGFSRVNVENTGFESRTDNTHLIQPRVFTELMIPGAQKLRPYLGLGYSYVNVLSNYTFENGGQGSNTGIDYGFNFNLGISYNISNRFFVQAQYDFIDLTPNVEVPEGVILLSQDIKGNINNIRLGIGYRF